MCLFQPMLKSLHIRLRCTPQLTYGKGRIFICSKRNSNSHEPFASSQREKDCTCLSSEWCWWNHLTTEPHTGRLKKQTKQPDIQEGFWKAWERSEPFQAVSTNAAPYHISLAHSEIPHISKQICLLNMVRGMLIQFFFAFEWDWLLNLQFLICTCLKRSVAWMDMNDYVCLACGNQRTFLFLCVA